MFDLLLLGTPQVANSGNLLSGRGVQRRRVAILALLGCAPGHILSRDKLVAYLWPESRTDIARHRLSVALHELRRAMGEAAIVSHGDDVRLNTNLVRIDAAEFESSRTTANWSRAIALYRGPLLDGFFLDDAPEFEHWAEGAREQYARMFADTLDRAAEACASIGDHEGELSARRLLAAHDPLSTQAALDLIRILSIADRSAALQHARLHTERMHEEFDAEPDVEFTEFVAQLRAAPTPGRRSPPDEHAVLPAPAATPPRRRWPRTMVVAVLPLLAIGGWTAWSSLANSEAAPVTRLAVLPFELRGTSELAYLREGMVDLLSTNLNGAGDIRTIDPHALFDALADDQALNTQIAIVRDKLGATSYITGSIYIGGDRLRVNASLYDIDSSRPTSSATVDGMQDDIFALVDEVSRQLIGNALHRPGERPVRIAAATTRSMPALKAYLAGEHAFRSGKFVMAADEFARAATLDTTFAIANYRLALSMLWADVPDTLPFEPEARALRFSSKLPQHDQQLIRAFIAWRHGDAREAEQIYRGIVRMYPDDSEAWLQLGETLYHYNPLLGRSVAEADDAFQRAAALDPESWAALWHRALIAGSIGDAKQFQALIPQLRAMKPESAQLLELNAVDAYVRRDPNAIARVQPDLAHAAPLQLFQIAWRLATLAQDSRAAEQLIRMALAQSSEAALVPGYSALASLAAARGDRAGVDAAVRMLARADANGVFSTCAQAFFAANPALHYSEPELEAILSTLRALRPKHAGEELQIAHATGLLASKLHRTEELRDQADAFERLLRHVDDPAAHAGSLAGLRARVAVLDGRPDSALALLSEQRNVVWFGWSVGSPYWSQVADRFLHGELLEKAGRMDEALRWYDSIEHFSVYDLAYQGAARAQRAQIQSSAGSARQVKR